MPKIPPTRFGCCVMLLAAALVPGMSQPMITIASLESEGVVLLPFSSPEFSKALDPARDPALDRLLPYAVLIKNGSGRTIIAYSVRWLHTDTAERVGLSEATVFDFSIFPSSSSLAPGENRVVSTTRGLGYPWLRYAQIQGKADNTLAMFARQRRIVVSLESVLFEDGTAIGPDSNHWIQRWHARIEADRDIYNRVISDPLAARSALQSMAAEGLDLARSRLNASDITEAHLYEGWRKSAEYHDSYIFVRAHLAMGFLDQFVRVGEAPTIQAMRGRLLLTRYPNVNRKDIER